MIRQISCPFVLCWSEVEVVEVPPYPGRDKPRSLVKEHRFVNLDYRYRGSCPASLMDYPLNTDRIMRLMEEVERFHRMKRDQPEPLPPDPDVDNVSHREGGRPGREPKELQDPSWVLGGREDEDIPEEPQEPGRQAPHYTGIYQRGTVSSIAEMIAAVNSAGAAEQEAFAAINIAQEEIPQGAQLAMSRLEAAASTYRAMLSEAESGRIRAALVAVERAIEQIKQSIAIFRTQLEQSKTYINQAGDENEAFVVNISS